MNEEKDLIQGVLEEKEYQDKLEEHKESLKCDLAEIAEHQRKHKEMMEEKRKQSKGSLFHTPKHHRIS